ncbi:hypothetical protein AWC38_SpisGene10486 [Stylophora pistillata]|uniref:PML C-terminal domain-containing protein n=1 Tax=Stylophora pistillata TaxID=50429 RepID=A0A2B4S684_STYPI|nr:hypothetical protein AWC38_SpisGene10486 [Stylophora pistillata]
MDFLDGRHERMYTFKDKLYLQGDNGLLVKENIIQKIAESGLCYDDLKDLYNNGGKEALVSILSKSPTTSRRSAPRGTKHPDTLHKLIQHFQAQSTQKVNQAQLIQHFQAQSIQKLPSSVNLNPTPGELMENNTPLIRKRQKKKGQVLDYGIQAEDDVPDMNLGDLVDEPVLPQNDKQIVPKPPSYEGTFPEFYIDPQYSPEQPPEYYEDEVPDYEIEDGDMERYFLNKLNIQDHENVEKILNQETMNQQTKMQYIFVKLSKTQKKETTIKWSKSTINNNI